MDIMFRWNQIVMAGTLLLSMACATLPLDDPCDDAFPPSGDPEIQSVSVEIQSSSLVGEPNRENLVILRVTMVGCTTSAVDELIDLELCENSAGCVGDIYGGSLELNVFPVGDERTVAVVVEDESLEEIYSGESTLNLSGSGVLGEIELFALVTGGAIGVQVTKP